MEKTCEYAIELLRYVLDGKEPKIKEDTDFNKLYLFGKMHDIENMFYVALNDLKINVPEDVMKKFEKAYLMSVNADVVQSYELEALSKAFEKAEIDFMPLKGSIIKHLYPETSYRRSSDIDILIRPSDKKKAHAVMKENGYEVDAMDEYELHEGYRKPPFLLVEIHDRLVEKDNRAYDVLSQIWEHVTLKENTKHCYVMSSEMFYVFTVAHLCKHIKNGGAGIKFITDIHVLEKEYPNSARGEKTEELLKKANMKEFETEAHKIAEKWFGNGTDETACVKVLEKFILSSGSYGNEEQKRLIKVSSAAESKGKRIRYRIKRVAIGFFPSYRELKKRYTWLSKCPVLLPVAWVLRAVRLLTTDRKRVSDQLTIDTEKTEGLGKVWEMVK